VTVGHRSPPVTGFYDRAPASAATWAEGGVVRSAQHRRGGLVAEVEVAERDDELAGADLHEDHQQQAGHDRLGGGDVVGVHQVPDRAVSAGAPVSGVEAERGPPDDPDRPKGCGQNTGFGVDPLVTGVDAGEDAGAHTEDETEDHPAEDQVPVVSDSRDALQVGEKEVGCDGGDDVTQRQDTVGPATGPVRALCAWSPPRLPADTPAKRQVDRLLPATGIPMALYSAAVIGLLGLAPLLNIRTDLAIDGLAAVAAAAWCGANFWRCRHAHCVVTATGWSGLGAFCFVEAALGRVNGSLIGGHEQPLFLAVLVLGLIFEGGWVLRRGTNTYTKQGAAGR
jgi:hypothetical protein